jgi:SHS2 domain-containing protein
MPYETIDDITRADIAFRISGRDLNELFFSGAQALVSVMVDNPESIVHETERKINIKNSSLDMLLYDFLDEIVFIKDAESILLYPQNIKITNLNNIYYFDCELSGETIDGKKHKLKVDIKAVTMHNLNVIKTETGWEAVFVLDL